MYRFRHTRASMALSTAVVTPQRWCSKTTNDGAKGGKTEVKDGQTAEPEKPTGSKISRLIKEYGAPFAVWYLIMEEGSWAALTAVLHFGLLGDVDATTLLEKCGASYDFQGSSVMVFGYEVSAKLMANIGAAGAIVTVGSPLIVGFCVMTLPAFKAVTGPILRRYLRGSAAPSPK